MSISLTPLAAIKHLRSTMWEWIHESRRPCPKNLTLSAACINGDILIWQDTSHGWNSSTWSWIMSMDVAAWAEWTFKVEISKENEPTVWNGNIIHAWRKCYMSTVRSIENIPRMKGSMKDTLRAHQQQNSRQLRNKQEDRGHRFLRTSVWYLRCGLLVW